MTFSPLPARLNPSGQRSTRTRFASLHANTDSTELPPANRHPTALTILASSSTQPDSLNIQTRHLDLAERGRPAPQWTHPPHGFGKPSHTLPPMDMSYEDLSGEDLSGEVFTRDIFTGTNLDGALLRGTTMRDCSLAGASLRDAKMYGAKLIGGTLLNADLTGAILKGAVLDCPIMEDMDLTRANLSGAYINFSRFKPKSLQNAILTGVIAITEDVYRYPEGEYLKRIPGVSKRVYSSPEIRLDRTQMQRAKLYGVNLSGVSLREANLNGAKLINADLSGVDFYGTQLLGTDLSGANLVDAKNLEHAVINRNTKFEGANLRGTAFMRWVGSGGFTYPEEYYRQMSPHDNDNRYHRRSYSMSWYEKPAHPKQLSLREKRQLRKRKAALRGAKAIANSYTS